MLDDNRRPLRRGPTALRLMLPVLAILMIAWLGWLLTRHGPQDFEVAILFWFRRDADTAVIAGPAFMADLWLTLTWLGDSGPRILIAGLGVAALVLFGRWQSGLFAAAVLVSGILMSTLLKQIIARPRPQWVAHLDAVHSASFPSGHALNSTLFYLLLALLLGGLLRSRGARLGLYCAALLVAIATGISRIALGVHYPSDVIAGWLIAAAWLWFCWALAARYWPQAILLRRT